MMPLFDRNFDVDYEHESTLFCSINSGEVVLVDTSDDIEGNWELLASLRGGHEEMVRCAALDHQVE